MSYIDNNYNCKITLNDLCRLSNMSRSTLLSQFHTLCNCSPTEYIQSVRIDNAKKMLAIPIFPSLQLQECGFYDSSHFTKTFSKDAFASKDYRTPA
ncbi:MAG: helix-turn-helix transcriptional regulator [Christensenellaceae bacterium]